MRSPKCLHIIQLSPQVPLESQAKKGNNAIRIELQTLRYRLGVVGSIFTDIPEQGIRINNLTTYGEYSW